MCKLNQGEACDRHFHIQIYFRFQVYLNIMRLLNAFEIHQTPFGTANAHPSQSDGEHEK